MIGMPEMGDRPLPSVLQQALERDRALYPLEIRVRSQKLVEHLESVGKVQPRVLSHDELWDAGVLRESLAPFLQLLSGKYADDYGVDLKDRPVPLFEDATQKVVAYGWPIRVAMRDDVFFPASLYAAINGHHCGMGYNPFFWIFTRNKKLTGNPFREGWINEADGRGPILGGVLIRPMDLPPEARDLELS